MPSVLSKPATSALAFALAILLSGTPALAVPSAVQGRVEAEDLPAGSAVRATSETSPAEARFAAIADDGTYQFFDLPEGDWRLDVIAPGGTLIPPLDGVPAVVTAPATGVTQRDLAVDPAAVEEDDGGTGAPPPGGGGVKPWVIWTTVGAVLGAVAIAALVTRDSDEEPCTPSLSPSIPCP